MRTPRISLLTLGAALLLAAPGLPRLATGHAASAAPVPGRPKPTLENVRYGPHERNVLDFYRAKSVQPAPLVFYLHSGGWLTGDKSSIDDPSPYLNAGISVVSINYRYTTQAGDLKPPVKAPSADAARALQFVRSQAQAWNLDPERICASGASAGGCTALWLAFHPDLADPKSSDPVARASTRVRCAAVLVPQTTLDPLQMRQWTPNSTYGGHAFGFTGDPARGLSQFDEFLAHRGKILPWIAEYSPYALVTKDDPPVYLFYGAPPNLGHDEKDPTHTANFGVKLQERCREVGVECELAYLGAPDRKQRGLLEFVVDKLKARSQPNRS